MVGLPEGSEEVSLVLSGDSPGRSGVCVVDVWSRASANDGEKRVGEKAARAAVEAVDIAPVSRLFEVPLDEPHAPAVVQLVPHGDRLGGKTAV